MKHARALPAEGGSVADLQVDMDTMVQAVEPSLKSLHDIGKRPDKLGRYYKKGELRTREMLKQARKPGAGDRIRQPSAGGKSARPAGGAAR